MKVRRTKAVTKVAARTSTPVPEPDRIGTDPSGPDAPLTHAERAARTVTDRVTLTPRPPGSEPIDAELIPPDGPEAHRAAAPRRAKPGGSRVITARNTPAAARRKERRKRVARVVCDGLFAWLFSWIWLGRMLGWVG